MWLENIAPVGPVQTFKPIELPSLSLIIGPNGAGKSQLLSAIANGRVRTLHDLQSQPIVGGGAIELLTVIDPSVSALVHEVETANPNSLKSSAQNPHASVVVEELQELQRKEIADLTSQGLLADCTSPEYIESKERLRQATISWASKLGNEIDCHDLRRGDADLIQWERHQFAGILGWKQQTLLSADVVNVFREYHDRRWQNVIQRANDLEGGSSIAFSAEQFREMFGDPPWERVTKVLNDFGLPYRVLCPDSDVSKPVSLIIAHKETGHTLQYNSLSSGEQIMLRMALSVFKASDDKTNLFSPYLILLDELDALLHPENVKLWLSAIIDVYIKQLGVNCIITTHSPTTVALAPEGSVFEISSSGPWLQPVSKQRAIDRLTYNLPMVSVDYGARRQVFVESNIDANHYSMLIDIIRPHLAMNRSLSFLGTGTHGSCTFVYNMVNSLEQNGNRAIGGIVDWDLKNEPTNRVKVLSPGQHYAKDNVLLDPLLVAALLLKDDYLREETKLRYSDIGHLNEGAAQALSDVIVNQIKLPYGSGDESGQNSYLGGLHVNVCKAYQIHQGHDLEYKIKSAFPMLQKHRSEGELVSSIISRVIADFPHLCPQPIAAAFLQLSNDQF